MAKAWSTLAGKLVDVPDAQPVLRGRISSGLEARINKALDDQENENQALRDEIDKLKAQITEAEKCERAECARADAAEARAMAYENREAKSLTGIASTLNALSVSVEKLIADEEKPDESAAEEKAEQRAIRETLKSSLAGMQDQIKSLSLLLLKMQKEDRKEDVKKTPGEVKVRITGRDVNGDIASFKILH